MQYVYNYIYIYYIYILTYNIIILFISVYYKILYSIINNINRQLHLFVNINYCKIYKYMKTESVYL